MKIHSILAITSLGLAGLASADYDFNNYGDEPAVYYFSSSIGSPPTGATMQDILWAGSGNPGGFYEFRGTWNAGPYEVYGGMAAEQWYAPQTAADYITSIDITADYRKNAGGANLAPQFIIFQGSKTFVADLAPNTGTTNTWLTVTKHLTAADFYEIRGVFTQVIGDHDFNSHPDFSSTSGVGIHTFLGSDMVRTTSGAAGSAKMQYDNYLIHINTVPEPVSLVPILAGLAGLAIRRRRSSKSS